MMRCGPVLHNASRTSASRIFVITVFWSLKGVCPAPNIVISIPLAHGVGNTLSAFYPPGLQHQSILPLDTHLTRGENLFPILIYTFASKIITISRNTSSLLTPGCTYIALPSEPHGRPQGCAPQKCLTTRSTTCGVMPTYLGHASVYSEACNDNTRQGPVSGVQEGQQRLLFTIRHRPGSTLCRKLLRLQACRPKRHRQIRRSLGQSVHETANKAIHGQRRLASAACSAFVNKERAPFRHFLLMPYLLCLLLLLPLVSAPSPFLIRSSLTKGFWYIAIHRRSHEVRGWCRAGGDPVRLDFIRFHLGAETSAE